MKRYWLILTLVLVASPIAALAYYWNTATKLPSWYTSKSQTPQTAVVNDTATIQQINLKPQPTIQDKIAAIKQQGNQKNVEINLTEADLNDLVISEVVKKTGNKKLPEAVKGINTTIQNGKIESGAVVNISQIPTAKLPKKERSAITKLTKTFPFLENQEVYVAVAGKPSVKNGQIQFDDHAQIKVGNLSFTVAEISQKLGIPKEQLEKRINLELKLGTVKVEDIELLDQQALIKGSSKGKTSELISPRVTQP